MYIFIPIICVAGKKSSQPELNSALTANMIYRDFHRLQRQKFLSPIIDFLIA